MDARTDLLNLIDSMISAKIQGADNGFREWQQSQIDGLTPDQVQERQRQNDEWWAEKLRRRRNRRFKASVRLVAYALLLIAAQFVVWQLIDRGFNP